MGAPIKPDDLSADAYKVIAAVLFDTTADKVTDAQRQLAKDTHSFAQQYSAATTIPVDEVLERLAKARSALISGDNGIRRALERMRGFEMGYREPDELPTTKDLEKEG